MKILYFILLFVLLFSYEALAKRDHYVRGYFRKNGTYVQPYMRTNRDRTRNNNYSTRGNVNPYTGIHGTKPRDEDFNYKHFKFYK